MENRPKPQIPINDINSYPNASISAKKSDIEKPKVKPKPEGIVDSANVTMKKKSMWRKAKHRIFEQEGAEIKNYLVNDVFFPTVKEMISTAVSNGIDMLLYGEARHISQRRSNIVNGGGVRYGNYVSYNSISSARPYFAGGRGSSDSSANRRAVAIDDFVFRTYDSAFDVLYKLCTILCDYGVATVNDLYGCIKNEDGEPLTCPWTYQNYGWTDRDIGIDVHEVLENASHRGYRARIIRLGRDGYYLDLPDPHFLDG